MPKYYMKFGWVVFWVSLIIVQICFIMNSRRMREQIRQEVQRSSFLPSPMQIQEELVKRGYKIKADGKIGNETLKAWDRAICNQYAEKEFEPQSSQRQDR